MSQPNPPPAGSPRAGMSLADWRVSHRVALGVIIAGLLMMVASPFVGDPFYDQIVTPIIELLGAPEGRAFLHPQDPETGAELLALLGGAHFAVGVCMFCVLLVLELLGLTGAPALTGAMRPRGKLALGAAAAGLAVFAAGQFPKIMLSLLFADHEPGVPGINGAFDVIAQAGGLLIGCAVITLFLGGDRRHGRLLGWTEAVGWGKVRRGWINTLALALIAGGLIGMLRFIMPFDDVAGAFFTIGLIVLALGVVPQALAIWRP